ncbi:anti-sigma factor family protein [Patulibacter minatonensis]|uniref:anti-sigma factor family protein n=1 Tax=Patulibacter minatonensis TaxID=298163 RepID=UPI00047DFFC4|nr:zf-HC2 domain-containing protein [Patulibacter minatonensis]
MRLGFGRRHLDDGPPVDLSAYVDGELRGRRRRWIARHLRACPACRLYVEQFVRVRELVRALRDAHEVPAGARPPADVVRRELRVRRLSDEAP